MLHVNLKQDGSSISLHHVGVESTLKKILFPVQRLGVYITAEWELFFFILPPPQNVWSKFHHFLTKKKGENKKDWPQFRPPAGQETDFFKGGLTQNKI